MNAPASAGDAAGVARFGLADLQIHTAHGDGMADAQALLDHVEQHTDLDIIAVTDHDDVAGALKVREAHARGCYRFELVTGIELTTRSGHMLALWVDEPLRSLRPLDESIAAIHAAGGVAVVPHPFSWLTRSVGQRALERVLAQDDAETRPEGIEVANQTLAGRVTGAKALRLNRRHYRLAETGGSDAHFLEHVGSAATRFPGTSSTELRRAIEAGQTAGRSRPGGGVRAIGARRLAEQQIRGLSATPRALARTRVLPWLRRATGALR